MNLAHTIGELDMHEWLYSCTGLAIDDGKFDLTSCSHMEVVTTSLGASYIHLLILYFLQSQ